MKTAKTCFETAAKNKLRNLKTKPAQRRIFGSTSSASAAACEVDSAAEEVVANDPEKR